MSAASNTITLYDIPGTASPDGTYSSNVWRSRYALHIKGLPYKVVWLEYPEIAPTMVRIGADPTGTRDGQPMYTCPVIHDPTTGKIVSDALKIAKYLDEQYPATPQLLPAHSSALQVAFLESFINPRIRTPIFQLVILDTAKQLNPPSEEFFRKTRVPIFGPLEEVARGKEERDALLKKLIGALEELAQWKGDSLFLGGAEVSYADILVAVNLRWLKTVGRADEWKVVDDAIAGKWASFLGAFAKWDVITAQ